ncbi:hypothetical protein GCM10009801_48780 [Streptomyces albiaxialis]|uniref:Uncharacterized protein n=1 Tax=Streptomyces albiaxialis TaxID=329523 RepID=A0ABN2W8P8_9ACTN
MQPAETPPDEHAEVHIVAETPEAARRVAETIRRHFAATEQRSYPAGDQGGTRLELTVDTNRAPEPAQTWLDSSRSAENDVRQSGAGEPSATSGPSGP